jgi:chromosome segregation ATPase
VKNVSAELKDAQKKQDYVSVGEKRDQLSKAEAEQSTVQEQLTEVQDLQKQYTSLIALAQERLDALDRNREALIAGIRVVDMPGIDSLGVLQGTQKQGRKKSNGSLRPFGGL